MFKKFLVFLVVLLESFTFINFSYIGSRCLAYSKEKTTSEKLVTSKEESEKQPSNSVVVFESNINVNEGENKIKVQKESRVSINSAEPFVHKKKFSVSATTNEKKKIGINDTTAVTANKDVLKTKETNEVGIFRKILNKINKWFRRYRFFGWVPNSIKAAIGEIDLTFAATNFLCIIFKHKDVFSILEDYVIVRKISPNDIPKEV